LECHCGCGRSEIDVSFLELLEDLRAWVGKPLMLSSAFRCPEYNSRISATGYTGPHTTGHAVDILCFSELAYDVVKGAYLVGFTGIGVKQKGNLVTRFIHLDDLSAPDFPRPRVWTY
jgi:hypothetical protein